MTNLPIDQTKLRTMEGLQKSFENSVNGASFTGNNEFAPPTYETIYNDYLYANLGKPNNAIIQESLPIIINKLCFQMSSQKEHVISKCDELIKHIGEKENSFENNVDSIVRVKIKTIENYLNDKLKNKQSDADVNSFAIAVGTTIDKIKSKLKISQTGGDFSKNLLEMFRSNNTSENSASNDAPESVSSSKNLVELTLTSLNHVTTETENEKYGSEYIEQLFGSIIMKCKHIIEYKIGSYYDDNFSKTLGLHTVNNHLDQIIDMIRHVLKEKLLTNLAPFTGTGIPATGTQVQQEQSETTKIATAIATAVEQTTINQKLANVNELAKQTREHKDVAMAIAAAVSHSDAINLHGITLEDENHTDIAVAVATAATEAITPKGLQKNPTSDSNVKKYTKRVKIIGNIYGTKQNDNTKQTGGNRNIPSGISEPDPNPKQYDNDTWVENLNSVKDYANEKNNELKEYKMSDDSQIIKFIDNIGTRIGAIDASDKINRIFDYLKEQIKMQYKLKSSVYAKPLHGMSKISKEATRFMDKNIRPWVDKKTLSSGNYVHLRPNTKYDHEGKSVKYMDENIPIIANNTAIKIADKLDAMYKIADKLDAMDKSEIRGLIDKIFSKLSEAVNHHYADNKNVSYTKTTIELCIPDYDHRSIFKEIVLQKYRFGIKNRLKLAHTALGAAHKTTCSLITEYCKNNIGSDEKTINYIINNIINIIWESVDTIDKNKYGTCYFTRETDETVQGSGRALLKNVSQFIQELGSDSKKLPLETKLSEAVKQFVEAQLKYKSFEAAYNDNSFINIVTSLVQGNKLKSYYLYNVVPDPEYLAEEYGKDEGNDAPKKYTVNGDNFKTYMGVVFKAAFETLNKENAPVEDNNKTFLETVGEWLPFSGGKRIQHKYNRRIRNDITKKKRKSHAIKMRNKTIRRQV
jgi:hypothetical protein